MIMSVAHDRSTPCNAHDEKISLPSHMSARYRAEPRKLDDARDRVAARVVSNCERVGEVLLGVTVPVQGSKSDVESCCCEAW